MSSLSASAMSLTRALFEDPKGKARNKVTYEVLVSDLRDDETSIVSMKFTLKEPIDEEELLRNEKNIFGKLSSELLSTAATQLGTSLLSRYGFSTSDFKKPPKIRGVVDIRFGKIEDTVAPGISAGVQTAKGRLLSQANLRTLLELTMKDYMLQEMTSVGAGSGRDSVLRNRTGRFVNTTEVVSTAITNNKPGLQQNMSIYYRYMVYPYQVFDPRNTQSPQKNLASNLRNPQRIIGNALARAARVLLGENYRITVKQVI